MQTLELLERALAINPSPKHWCDELKVARSALNVARLRGRLSPALAGGLAMKLNENPTQWVAIAALEAEPKSALTDQLKARFRECRFSSMERRQKLRHSNTERRSTPRGAFFMPGCFGFEGRH